MATTRIMPLHVGKGRTESRAISDIIDYVANPQKTDSCRLIIGYACDSRTADAEFLLAKRQYIAATGRVRGADDVIAYHVRQSFRPGEITPEEANRLADQAKPSHRELLRVAIDNALSQSPADFEELLKLLQEFGCEVSKRGKSYRLKLPGWEKAARMDSLGEGYGLEDLQAVLSGKKAHTPRKKTVTQAEIAVLRTHIVNYAKIREVYVAYRKGATLRNFGKNMRKKFCSTRLLRMPLMRWESRSCPRSKSYRRSTRNCWKKRKRPMPSTGVPVRKCGSF